MAFIDRVVEFPGRIRLTPVQGQSDVYDMTREEGTIYTEGTLLNANNLNIQTQLDPAAEALFQAEGMTGGTYQNGVSDALGFIAGKPFVTEEGTNGAWHFRKWSNGTTEAWSSVTGAAQAGRVWTAPIYYYDLTVTFPTGLFSAAPNNIQLANNNAQWVPLGANAVTASGFNVRLIKPTTSAQAIAFFIYAIHYSTT